MKTGDITKMRDAVKTSGDEERNGDYITLDNAIWYVYTKNTKELGCVLFSWLHGLH